jgi:hypothetical protein
MPASALPSTAASHGATALIATLAIALTATAPAAGAAKGEILPLAWPADGSFSRSVSLAPGRFVEVCGPLPAQQAVQWRFEAEAPLDFNIHYHEGKAVHYPARQAGVAQAAGTLETRIAQDYCWMWTNPSGQAATLKLVLQRR